MAEAVNDWLSYGLNDHDEGTRKTNRIVSEVHILPLLGKRKLRELTAQDVDHWLADRAKHLSKSSLEKAHSALNRSVKRAMA